MSSPRCHADLNRRRFIQTLATAAAGVCCCGRGQAAPADAVIPAFPGVPIIDIHQHPFLPRTDEELATHQRNTGCACAILMPSADTSERRGGMRWAQALSRGSGGRYRYCANASVTMADPARELEPFLAADAAGIGELKERIRCDSPYIHRLADLAAAHDVPVLLHFEEGNFNSGFTTFYRVIERHPKTRFIGHAQTFWAQIDAKCPPDAHGYPRGKVTPGGLSDRWLSDYPNFYGDLASGSGNTALARDPDFAADFLVRHQDKLVYGSDCPCHTGVGPTCIAAVKQKFLKQLCPSPEIRAKLLFRNARRIYRGFSAPGPAAA